MTDLEAQARRYLVLFPGWMRADRGEEAVGLVLDLLPPGAERLPLRARSDLVRAGLHARRVGIPPGRVWWSVVAARAKGRPRPVPPAWRPWLAGWLRSPRWRFRYAATCTMPAALLVVVLGAFAWRAGRLDTMFTPVWFALLGGWSGWRSGQEWRETVSVVNGLDPVTVGELPSGDRRPVVIAASVVGGRAVDRVDALFGWCALVVVGSALAAAAGWGPSDTWGVGPAVAGLLLGGSLAGLGAAMALANARSLAARPAPVGAAVEPLAAPPSTPRWVARLAIAGVAVATIAMFGWFAAGAAVATATVGLVVRLRLRAVERTAGHPVTVWGLFPWAGPAVRWLEVANDDQTSGPAPA